MSSRWRAGSVARIALAGVLLLAVGCSDDRPGASDRSAPASGEQARRQDEPPAMVTAPLSSTTEAWWAYKRAGTFGAGFTPVDVPMRDGVTLGCTLGRPWGSGLPAAGTFPGLIVQFTPYTALASVFSDDAAFFTTRGYNTLVCTIRGTGRSGGTWQNAMSSQDGRDAHDLVEWLATQPFSDGRIGQFGHSYGGQTSYGAAVERPPHLLAVAPMQPPGNLYEDVIYPGGIKATEDGTIDNWPGIAEGITGGAVDPAAEYGTNRAHPTFDEYWQERAMAGRLDDIEVPVLTIGGWNDHFFRSGTLADIEGAPDRTWAIYGPWDHTPPIDYPCTGCTTRLLPSGVLLAWFDHWVMEEDGVPIPPEPTFVSFEGPEGPGVGWREVSRWDPEGADAATFQLGSDGTLATTVAATGPVTFHEAPGPPFPVPYSATFDSAPLDADRVLLGHPTLQLRATLTAEDANFHVELIDLYPDGTERVVNDGFLKASHRSSHETPEPVTPGEPVDYEIAVRADHHRFTAGHRVRLRISAGHPGSLVPPAAPVDVTVLTGEPSTLRLPGFATATSGG
jgi:predicted acyl esterase